MDKINQAIFTTGEFARICNTTKETLFHYDKIGLLKPQFIGDNRYRYYSAIQFYNYDLIDTLQAAGCTLAEIKEYLTSYDPQKYMELLERCSNKLEQKRLEIEKMQRVLKNSRDSVKAALEVDVNEPYVEECETEYFIITPFSMEDELEELFSMRDHFAYCGKYALGEDFSIGGIMMEEEMRQGKFVERYYYSKISGPVSLGRLYEKPAGCYVSMLHKGTYAGIPDACRRLITYMEEQGYELAGNGYSYDLISYFASQEETEFVLKVSLAVRRKVI